MKSLALWPLRLFERLLVAVLVFLCRFWQILVSPLVGARCRFYPTCSHYAVESLHKHGLLRGCLLTLGRIARCHPLARGGIDPVPDSNREPKGREHEGKHGQAERAVSQ